MPADTRLGLQSPTLPPDCSRHKALCWLCARERTGRGQHVDIAMLDSVAALLTYQAGIYFVTGAPPRRHGNAHPTVAPYETFQAADGEVVLAAGNDELWRKFCRVAGLDAFAADPRFATNRDRVRNYGALRPIVAEAFSKRTRSQWLEMLNDAGIPAGPVRNLREVLTDEQLLTREMVHVLQHSSAGPVQVLGVPVKLSATPGAAVARRRRWGNTPKKSSLETWGLPHRRSTSCGRLALSDATTRSSGSPVRGSGLLRFRSRIRRFRFHGFIVNRNENPNRTFEPRT